MAWKLFFQDIIKGKRKGIVPFVIKIPLLLLSYIYRFVIFCRNLAYDKGLAGPYTPPIPLVISVGNIVVGGTGKTPFTLLLANSMREFGSIGIASRGYRSKAEYLKIPVVVSAGNGPLQPAAISGDEPYLLASNLPWIHVFSGRNRQKASEMAALAGVQALILDDAFQHRQLARDFDIVLIDASDPFGGGYFLPRGLLRESVKSLSRASLIVLNYIDNQAHFDAIKEKIAKYSAAPVIGVQMEVQDAHLKGKKVGVFCGLANPERFLSTVKDLGAIVVAEKYFEDHCLGDIAPFSDHCRELGADLLVCSEKDQVKLSGNFSLPIQSVKIHFKVVQGEVFWEIFLAKVKMVLDYKNH